MRPRRQLPIPAGRKRELGGLAGQHLKAFIEEKASARHEGGIKALNPTKEIRIAIFRMAAIDAARAMRLGDAVAKGIADIEEKCQRHQMRPEEGHRQVKALLGRDLRRLEKFNCAFMSRYSRYNERFFEVAERASKRMARRN